MYKNREKNNRKNFEIPALLSCEWGNPEQENSKKILRYIYNFEFSRYLDFDQKKSSNFEMVATWWYTVWIDIIKLFFLHQSLANLVAAPSSVRATRWYWNPSCCNCLTFFNLVPLRICQPWDDKWFSYHKPICRRVIKKHIWQASEHLKNVIKTYKYMTSNSI